MAKGSARRKPSASHRDHNGRRRAHSAAERGQVWIAIDACVSKHCDAMEKSDREVPFLVSYVGRPENRASSG